MTFSNLTCTIDRDVILSSTNQLHVWWWILGFTVNLGEKFTLPGFIRPDRRPGAFLHEYNWMTLLYDFGHPEIHGSNIFHGIEKKYRCSFKDSLDIIWNEYILKHGVKITSKFRKGKDDSFQFELGYLPRYSGDFPVWNRWDKEYWEQYDISKEQLEFEKIYPVYKYYHNSRSNKKIRVYTPYKECYAAEIQDGIKIYQPNFNIKFITNLSSGTIGGRSELSGDTIFVTKSFKDHLVISNLGFNSRYIFSEGIYLTPEFINFLADFKYVIFLMDNDHAGMEAAKRFKDQFRKLTDREAFSFITPDQKDPSDFVKKYDSTELKNKINEFLKIII